MPDRSAIGGPRRSRRTATRIFVVSGFPPPPGGIAVHAERLCHLLLRQGYMVHGYETNPRTTQPVPRLFQYYSGHRMITSCRLLLDACRFRPALIHMHFSAISNPAPLLAGIPLLALLSPVITTIHSGSFPERASHMSVAARLILKNAFQPVSRFIATSQPIAEALGQYCRVPCEKISVIPAYLSPSLEELESVSGGEPGVFLASGYGTEIYFWDGLVEAARPLSTIRELVLAFYTDYQQPYFERVLERARGEFPFKVTIHRDLSTREFQRELARCSVFVRPTLKDGDSIALREALALGKTVVASDAAPRPPSCLLFRSGDTQDLRRKLEAASAHSCTRGQAADDFSQPLLKVYADVMASAHMRTSDTTQGQRAMAPSWGRDMPPPHRSS